MTIPGSEQDAGSFLKAAIMEAPANVRIFITQPDSAPSFLARERANRSLGIVDWDKLKFDADEISSLCDAAGMQGNGSLIAICRRDAGLGGRADPIAGKNKDRRCF